jgi:hypothetical protein
MSSQDINENGNDNEILETQKNLSDNIKIGDIVNNNQEENEEEENEEEEITCCECGGQVDYIFRDHVFRYEFCSIECVRRFIE